MINVKGIIQTLSRECGALNSVLFLLPHHDEYEIQYPLSKLIFLISVAARLATPDQTNR